MEKNNLVKVQMLREVLNNIFNFIEHDLGLSEIELNKDFYWSIDENNLYSMGNQPKQLDCGSLLDDLEFVLSAFNNPDRALPFTLLHIAPLLRIIATTIPNYTTR